MDISPILLPCQPLPSQWLHCTKSIGIRIYMKKEISTVKLPQRIDFLKILYEASEDRK